MISIIVPVYNTEKYLEAAINSVINQSYKDWELILVDDGSTDSAGTICDNYVSENPKIKVIHKTNGGLSSARNAGLDIVKGEFITFLDSDDELAPEALKILSEIQLISKADIVCGKYKYYKNCVPVIKKKNKDFKITTFTPEDAIEKILYQNSLDNSVCAKLFKKDLFKNVRFREGCYYEDLDIFYKIFIQANCVVSFSQTIYFYRQHSSSYVHTFNLQRKDMLSVTQRLVDYIQTNYHELLPAAQSRQLSANFNMFMLIAANQSKINSQDKEEANNIYKQCWNKIKSLRKGVFFDPKVRLKNKFGIIASFLGGQTSLKILSKFFY